MARARRTRRYRREVDPRMGASGYTCFLRRKALRQTGPAAVVSPFDADKALRRST
jgi:hypothetical protein